MCSSQPCCIEPQYFRTSWAPRRAPSKRSFKGSIRDLLYRRFNDSFEHSDLEIGVYSFLYRGLGCIAFLRFLT